MTNFIVPLFLYLLGCMTPFLPLSHQTSGPFSVPAWQPVLSKPLLPITDPSVPPFWLGKMVADVMSFSILWPDVFICSAPSYCHLNGSLQSITGLLNGSLQSVAGSLNAWLQDDSLKKVAEIRELQAKLADPVESATMAPSVCVLTSALKNVSVTA